jgi:hypothetical protein
MHDQEGADDEEREALHGERAGSERTPCKTVVDSEARDVKALALLAVHGCHLLASREESAGRLLQA